MGLIMVAAMKHQCREVRCRVSGGERLLPREGEHVNLRGVEVLLLSALASYTYMNESAVCSNESPMVD